MGPGALETALALYQAPSLAAATRLRPVPGDVFEVIRIAAGDQDAMAGAVARSGVDAGVVREASQLYLKHALFHPEADHYRVLGLAVGAGDEQLREHRRWLLKWLHPDRSDDWDAVYASRVQQAWQQLRDPSRREAYDAELAAAEDDWAAPLSVAALRPVWTPRALAAEPGTGRSPIPLRWVAGTAIAAIVACVAWLAWPAPGPSDRASLAQAPAVTEDDAPPAVVLEHVPFVAPFVEDPREPVEADPPARATPAAARSAAISRAAHAPVAPVATPTSTEVEPPAMPESRPAPQPLARDDIRDLMARFRQTYEDGDIDVLMTLFSTDARNRRGGVDAIREDYTRLFRSSRQRSLQWHSMDWQRSPGYASGEGGFIAVITPRRGAPNEVRGSVRVEVVQVDGRVRIRELWHEDHRQ